MLRSLQRLCAVLVTIALALAPQAALAIDTQPIINESTAACVTDANGNVLYDYNSEVEMPMASITKVMTAMVALDSGIPLDTPVEFTEQDYSEGAQLTGYKTGDKPSLDELLRVTLIYSGNDAATNVAYAVAGSKEAFADLMNKKAAELGMTHTHFMNPHGLEEDGHYSCAADLCKMGRYAMENYPFIRETVHMRSISVAPGGNRMTLESTDLLMDYYDGLLGIKTGNTESGASFLGSARRGRVTLYSCVLCCETGEGRWNDTESLLDWGYSLYRDVPLAQGNMLLRSAPWTDGFWLKCPVYAPLDITGSVFDNGQIETSTSTYAPGSFVPANTTYATSIWRQDGRHLGSSQYRTSSRPKQVAAWNPLVMPLFEDMGGVLS
ncbi:MAG: D-alanyl-D-alanine carboxypeptidase [Atopobiaceae bacterium]|nr:D-alanyl-D-alanine carboxypeptidase [Atopobiaceae bacterium]